MQKQIKYLLIQNTLIYDHINLKVNCMYVLTRTLSDYMLNKVISVQT